MTDFERGVASIVGWLRQHNFNTIANSIEFSPPVDAFPEKATTLPKPETVKAYVRAKLAYDNIAPGRLWAIPRESARLYMIEAALKLADEVCQ
jgi:hypothetical protein